MMQTILVVVMVVGAVGWLGWYGYRFIKPKAGAKGCGGGAVVAMKTRETSRVQRRKE
ncbi:MAG: hypothetical protein WCI73_19335 [Phycisphaerae bacterium]